MQELFIVFNWVILSSFLGSVLIGTILLAKAVFNRKLDAVLHYYIWFLLLIRLLIPYVPQSSVSIFNLLTPIISNSMQTNEYNMEKPDLKVHDKLGKTTTQNLSGNPNPLLNQDKSKKDVNANTTSLYQNRDLGFIIIWLTGILFYFGYVLILNLRFTIKVKRHCSKINDTHIQTIYEECKDILKIRADIPILFVDQIRTPSIFGMIRPNLLFPVHLTDQISDKELKYILLHELAHYKRKDIMVIWLSVIIKALHWFNPIIWYAFYRMRQDCESACDAFVMFHLQPQEHTKYGHMILHLLELGVEHKMIPGTAGILPKSNRIQMKRRITMISIFKMPTFTRVVISVALVALIGVSGLTGAQQVSAQEIKGGNSMITQQQVDVLPNSAKEVATLWAEALAQRNGALRFAVLNDDLKQKEYEYYNINRVIGGSSPLITNYTVTEKNKIDDSTYEYQIDYIMTDSTRVKYDSHENVTVKQYGQSWFVSKHDSYDILPNFKESSSPKFSKVQTNVQNTLPTKDAQGVATLWAEALKQREGAFRFALLDNDLKNQEGKKYKAQNWVIGGSSPWIVCYTVNQKNKIDNCTYVYTINYILTDSTGAKYGSCETITIKGYGPYWFVSAHDNYDYMPSFTQMAK